MDSKQLVDRLLLGGDVRKSLMEEMPVNSDDLRVALFLQSVDGLIGAFMSVQSAWEDLEKEYPEFANIAAQKYPFKKSFDEIPLQIIDWRDEMKKELL